MEIVLDSFEAFVGVNLWTMLFAWVNLLILYIFLKKLLFKPVKKMIDDRQKEIDDLYSDAEAKTADASKMKVEYEERLKAASEESEEILRTALRRAQLREEEILRDAKAEATLTKRRAEEEIELEKKRAINEVKNEVSEMAVSIAEAVIEREISEDDHRALIDEFIEGMGDKK